MLEEKILNIMAKKDSSVKDIAEELEVEEDKIMQVIQRLKLAGLIVDVVED
jgi:predicted transcriptional regulator